MLLRPSCLLLPMIHPGASTWASTQQLGGPDITLTWKVGMGHPDRSVVILSTTLSSVYRFSFCGPVLVDLDPFRLETFPIAAAGANTKHLHEENSEKSFSV
ncbi:hypothetical protein XENOCAPTIV_024605 [Xenoophorus captivus]|uniref:Secreted protein n=1 Tax=Xenoophorus captivus TaxID=1517983 RepID=A0ABV0RA91_9TELE